MSLASAGLFLCLIFLIKKKKFSKYFCYIKNFYYFCTVKLKQENEMKVTIDIDIEDAYSNLYAREQAEFIEEHLTDLDVNRILTTVGEKEIVSWLEDVGYTITK